MNLDIQQQKAIQEGQTVPIIVAGTECVLLRKDVFDRVRRVIDDQDTLDADTVYGLMDAAMADDDASDAGLHHLPDVSRIIGSLSQTAMKQVDECLKAALGISLTLAIAKG